jgi:ATP-dependent Clp protease ATP-binding subunit ClpC
MGRGAQHIAVGDITITPRAQRVIDMARYESQRLGHAATGTEHLLLALIYEKESFTVRLLDALKVDPEKVRERTLAAMRVPSSYRAAEHADLNDGPYERFDEESRQVLAFAREEAMRLGHYWIGDDHILLGLVRAAANSAADQAFRHTIAKLGITVERLREEVAKIQPPREPRASTPVMKFTGNTKLIIELALQAAGEGAPVRPRHLLAALGTARNSFATYLLGRFGATPADLRFGAERTDDPPSQ